MDRITQAALSAAQDLDEGKPGNPVVLAAMLRTLVRLLDASKDRERSTEAMLAIHQREQRR